MAPRIDFTQVQTKEDREAAQATIDRATAEAEARRYLLETDWMVIRQAETGQLIPEEVSAARKIARQALDQPA